MECVRGLTFLLMLLGALGVLLFGALPASAMTGEASGPSCHEMAQESSSPTPAPSRETGKAMASMTCCVTCLVSLELNPPARPAAVHPDVAPSPRLTALPVGLSPSPEPGPPRS